MFTGIIEDTGKLLRRRVGAEGGRLRIGWEQRGEPLALGESIAVNGCCLTVVERDADAFEVDCSPHTLRLTTLGRLPEGARLNLERSLPAGARLGGHFVQGHVDGVGEVTGRHPEGDSVRMTFSRPAAVTDYLVARGSVAVDGISLTVALLDRDAFHVALIPHTLQVTNLGELQPGAAVNLEADILGKYVRHFLESGVSGPWTEGLVVRSPVDGEAPPPEEDR